jgi:hypothetical protein
MENREIKFRSIDNLGVINKISLTQSLFEGGLDQFTGCYDMNKTEIWENDVLKFEDGEIYPPVKFQNGAFGCDSPRSGQYIPLCEINLSMAFVINENNERI